MKPVDIASRPLFTASFFLSAGIITGHFVSMEPGCCYILSGVLSLCALGLTKRTLSCGGWVMAGSLILFGAGMIRYAESTLPADHIMHAPPVDEVAVIGSVRSVPEYLPGSGFLRFEMELSGIETDSREIERVSGKVHLLLCDPDPTEDLIQHLNPGCWIRVETTLQAPGQFWNLGGFHSREYYACRGIYLTGSVSYSEFIDVLDPSAPAGSLFASCMRFRQILLNHIHRHTSFFCPDIWKGNDLDRQSICQVSSALMLGNRTGLDPDIKLSFQQSGLIHLLAISGLHVGIIALILHGIIRIIPVSYHVRNWGTLIGIIGYSVLAGNSPSVSRATLIVSIILIGRLLDRKADLLNSLGCSAILLLIWNPLYLFDIGFQLTYCATLGIVLLYPSLITLIPVARRSRIVQLILISFAAQMATAPLSAYHFNRVAVWAFIPYIPLIPIVAGSLFSGLLGLIFFKWTAVSSFLLKGHGTLLWILVTISEMVSTWPGITFQPATPDCVTLSLWCLILLAVIASVHSKKNLWIAAALLFVFPIYHSLNAYSHGTSPLELTFLDVGNADSTLITLPSGRHLLVDGGGRYDSTFDIGRYVVSRTLRCLGVTSLFAVAVTHPHPDHQQGIISVLDEFPVSELWIPSRHFDDADFQRLLCIADRNDIIIRALDDRTIYDTWKVSVNNRSLVLGLNYDRFRVLLPGDAEKEAEAGLSRYGSALKSTLLKAGHHGSRTSSTLHFLEAVSPRVIIVPCGRNNRFGHPHLTTLRRMEQIDTNPLILRSDTNGMIRVITDGRHVNVSSFHPGFIQ
jgi:competence protein ComEC